MEEHNCLARELHDTVKQQAFATLMQVRAAKNRLEADPLAAQLFKLCKPRHNMSQRSLRLILLTKHVGQAGVHH
jgi:signal transduction histidine kinase